MGVGNSALATMIMAVWGRQREWPRHADPSALRRRGWLTGLGTTTAGVFGGHVARSVRQSDD